MNMHAYVHTYLHTDSSKDGKSLRPLQPFLLKERMKGRQSG